MSDKWKRVADTLAGRLMYHEFCNHTPPQENCPFCDDEAAMTLYRKVGGTMGIPSAQGRMVPIHEIETGYIEQGIEHVFFYCSAECANSSAIHEVLPLDYLEKPESCWECGKTIEARP